MSLAAAIPPASLPPAEAIQRHGWLAATPPPFRHWAANALQWRTARRGEVLTHAGDERGGLHCLAAGQIVFMACLGGQLVTSFHGFCGSWWGQAPLVGVSRTGTTMARTDSTYGVLPQAALKARLAAHPEEWEQLTRGMSDLFLQAAGAHSDSLIEQSRNRLAALILRLGGNRHRLFPVNPPPAFACTQDELARAAGLSRNTAGLHLRELQARGLVRIAYGEIQALDPDALRRLADCED